VDANRFVPLEAIEERGPDQIAVVSKVAILDRCLAGESSALKPDLGADADRKRHTEAQTSTAHILQEPGDIHDFALLIAVLDPDKFRAQGSLC
jgi:hypothetical protein